MKKVLLIPILLAIGLPLLAQSISPQVIASTGASFTQASAQLEFTVGEVAISTYDIGSQQLSQGFHQPLILIESVDDALVGYTFNVFPNPTTQSILLESNTPLASSLNIMLLDAKGSTLLEEMWQKTDTQKALNLNDLADGTYFLLLTDSQSHASRTFKVQKINH